MLEFCEGTGGSLEGYMGWGIPCPVSNRLYFEHLTSLMTIFQTPQKLHDDILTHLISPMMIFHTSQDWSFAQLMKCHIVHFVMWYLYLHKFEAFQLCSLPGHAECGNTSNFAFWVACGWIRILTCVVLSIFSHLWCSEVDIFKFLSTSYSAFSFVWVFWI